MSDCGAILDIFDNHRVRSTAEEAAVMAVRAGCELECGRGSWAPGESDAFLSLGDAVRAKLIQEGELDQALAKLLRTQFRLGAYDPEARVPYAKIPMAVVDSDKHQQLALEAARKSIVLLKNDKGTLPLRKDLKTLAVIGPNAAAVEVLLGNYNGTPSAPVSVLAGIRAKVSPATTVLHAKGSRLADGLPDMQVIPGSALFTSGEGDRVHGLRGQYYAGYFDGAPLFTRIDASVDFDWKDGAPRADMNDDAFSVRWTGELVAPATGWYTLGAIGLTGFRVWLEGKPIVQGHSAHSPKLATARVKLRSGRAYPILIEYYHRKYDAHLKLLWEVPGQSAEGNVIEAVKAADAVVLVLGLSPRLEGEEMPVELGGLPPR